MKDDVVQRSGNRLLLGTVKYYAQRDQRWQNRSCTRQEFALDCRICVKGGEATGLAPDVGFCILLSSGLFQQGFQMLHLQVLPVAPPAPYPGSESNPYVLHISGPVRCGLGFIQSRLRVQLGKVRAGGHQIRYNKLRK